MTDPETATPETTAPAGHANAGEESRMLLDYLQDQRDAVLKTVAGLPEEAWHTPVVQSGWTVAGMLWHLSGAEYHWFQEVTKGARDESAGKGGEYDPYVVFTCDDLSSAEVIAAYREECKRSDEVLAVTPLSAAPRGSHAPGHQVPNIRWIVLHVIEETATHSGHLEIARELLDGKTRLAGR